jgi:hypothetical protein
MQEIIAASNCSLEQLKDFLQQLKTEEYTQPLPVFSGSTLGMHTRHIVEFYQCLLQNSNEPEVNYDARKRNLQLENDVLFCCDTIQSIMQQLERLDKNEDKVLLAEIGFETNLTKVASSISRELIYLLEHTIHHMAILKMGCIVSFPHIGFDEYFGLAYSTIKYKQRVHSNVLA